MASTNPARGMRDFLPADVRKRNYVINIIKEVYESYGFEPLETPAVENIETLLGKYGEEGNQLVFKILKRGEKLDLENATRESDLSDLALRYDLTVPLARVVADNKNDLPKFFKRYQIQPVWRADRPARGRFREFYQCDVDAIGSSSMVVEAELISAVSDVLTKLGFDFIIKFNSRALLEDLVLGVEIPISRHAEVIPILDKAEKIGVAGVAVEMGNIGLGKEFYSLSQLMSAVYEDRRSILQELDSGKIARDEFSWNGFNQRTSTRISEFLGYEEKAEGVKHFEKLIAFLSPDIAKNVEFDPVLARGISYYTGSIMEVALFDTDFKVSIAGGGRYDGLIGMFGKEQIPACGFSLGLERILVVMEERGMFPAEIAESTPADVMVTIWNEESIADSLKLASDLRKQDLRVTVYPEADKLGKQFKYADSINVPFVCVLGDEEKSSGNVKLKNMTSGDERKLPIEEIGNAIRNQVH